MIQIILLYINYRKYNQELVYDSSWYKMMNANYYYNHRNYGDIFPSISNINKVYYRIILPKSYWYQRIK